MAKSIMVLGTTSNAGKSLLAAGLCRVFAQDGHRVAPFKSQNMALNSFVTREGLEMGRAQVMQAECAGIEPSVRMNPVLLKPTGDAGSQVIVNGEVLRTMTAAEYYQYKSALLPAVRRAYDELAAAHDIIVVEGAGSPAEINLREGDFVNMGLARMVGAPCLLVGDIDRGGVFASLYGTLALLTGEERPYVKGCVINKFRGDPGILRPGLDMLEDLTGSPVLGVLPYLCLDLDDEDSLSDRLTRRGGGSLIDVVVPRLPRLSNFTDFNALDMLPGVSVRYVSSPRQFEQPDLVILPGTKNTMDDLLWLRQNGLEAAVLKHAASGGPVIGVCGGYQMLGEVLEDPDGVERGGTLRGMGLLPCRTLFAPQKTRTRVTGRFGAVGGPLSPLSNLALEGYEIHMGITEPIGGAAPLADVSLLDAAAPPHSDGMQRDNVYGSYLHGLFDREGVAAAVVEALMRRRGLDPSSLPVLDLQAHKARQYDLLADALRAGLDLPRVYDILEAGV